MRTHGADALPSAGGLLPWFLSGPQAEILLGAVASVTASACTLGDLSEPALARSTAIALAWGIAVGFGLWVGVRWTTASVLVFTRGFRLLRNATDALQEWRRPAHPTKGVSTARRRTRALSLSVTVWQVATILFAIGGLAATVFGLVRMLYGAGGIEPVPFIRGLLSWAAISGLAGLLALLATAGAIAGSSLFGAVPRLRGLSPPGGPDAEADPEAGAAPSAWTGLRVVLRAIVSLRDDGDRLSVR